MSLVDIHWQPTERQLRQFAACAVVILPLVAWWWGLSGSWLLAIISFGVLLNLFAWLAPVVVRPIFIAAMLVTLPIGLVVGELALLTIFLGVFLPIGLVFRITGRDALRLRRKNQATYWEERPPVRTKDYFRQY